MTPPPLPPSTAPAPYTESLDPHPDFPGVRNFLVSISAMRAYAHLSTEELRLCDYTAAGSAAVPFARTQDADARPPVFFESLVAMPEYRHASPEEVRLEDYWVVNGGRAVRPPADGPFAPGAPAVRPAADDAFVPAGACADDARADAGGEEAGKKKARGLPRGRTQYGVRTRLRQRVEALARFGSVLSSNSSPPEASKSSDINAPSLAVDRDRTPDRPRPARRGSLGRSPSMPLGPSLSRAGLAASSSAHGLGSSPRRTRRRSEEFPPGARAAPAARARLFSQLREMARKAEAVDSVLAGADEANPAVQSLVAKAEEFSAALDRLSATGGVDADTETSWSPRRGPRYFDDPGFVGPLPRRTSFDSFVAPYPGSRARGDRLPDESGPFADQPRTSGAEAAEAVDAAPSQQLQFVPMTSVSVDPLRPAAEEGDAEPVRKEEVVSSVFKPLSVSLAPDARAADPAPAVKIEPALSGPDAGATAEAPPYSDRPRAAVRKRDSSSVLSPSPVMSSRRKMRTLRVMKKAKSETEAAGGFAEARSPFDFDGVLPDSAASLSAAKPPIVGMSKRLPKRETDLERIFPQAAAMEKKTFLSEVDVFATKGELSPAAFSMGSPPKDNKHRGGRRGARPKSGPWSFRGRSSSSRTTVPPFSSRAKSDNPFLQSDALNPRKLKSMEEAATAEAFAPAMKKRSDRMLDAAFTPTERKREDFFANETESDFASESDSSPAKASSDEEESNIQEGQTFGHESVSSSGSPVASPAASATRFSENANVAKKSKPLPVEADSDVFKSVRLLTAALEASFAEPPVQPKKSAFEHRVFEKRNRPVEDSVMRNMGGDEDTSVETKATAMTSTENTGKSRKYEIVALPHFGLPNVAPKKTDIAHRSLNEQDAVEEVEYMERADSDLVIDGEVTIDEEIEIEVDEEDSHGEDEHAVDDDSGDEDRDPRNSVTSPVAAEEEPFFIVLSRDASENSVEAVCQPGEEFTVENASAEVVISSELSTEHGVHAASPRDGQYSKDTGGEGVAPTSLSERFAKLHVSDSSDSDSFEARDESVFSASTNQADSVPEPSSLRPPRPTRLFGSTGMRSAPPIVAAQLPKQLAKFEAESDQEGEETVTESEGQSVSEFESESEEEEYFSPVVPQATVPRRQTSLETKKRNVPRAARVLPGQIAEAIIDRVQMFQDLFLHGAPLDDDFERMESLEQEKIERESSSAAEASAASSMTVPLLADTDEDEMPKIISPLSAKDAKNLTPQKSSLPRGLTMATSSAPRKLVSIKSPLKRHSTAANVREPGPLPTSTRLPSALRTRGGLGGAMPLGATIANAISSRLGVGSSANTTPAPASPERSSIVDGEVSPVIDEEPVSPFMANTVGERQEDAKLGKASLPRSISAPPRSSDEFDELGGGQRGGAGDRLVAMRSMHETLQPNSKQKKRTGSRASDAKRHSRKSRAKPPTPVDRERAKSTSRSNRDRPKSTGRAVKARTRTTNTAVTGAKEGAEDDHELAPRASTDVGTGRKSISEAISPTTVAVQKLIAEETTRMSVQRPEERAETKAGFVESVRRLFGRKARKGDGGEETATPPRRMSLSRARDKRRESASSRPSSARRAKSEYRNSSRRHSKK